MSLILVTAVWVSDRGLPQALVGGPDALSSPQAALDSAHLS